MVYVKFLCVTGNIGSLADGPVSLRKAWIEEVAKEIGGWQPDFAAVHLQKIAGKNSQQKNSGFAIEDFVQDLRYAEDMRDFECCLAFCDEDAGNMRTYTGLASVYFLKKPSTAKIWDFQANRFQSAPAYEYFGDDLRREGKIVKENFPNINFRKAATEGKGYMRTRWKIHDKDFNFVNLHLFNDGCNMAASEKFPSEFAEQRAEALQFILQRMEPEIDLESTILAGHFNWRLDLHGLLEEIAGVKHAVVDEVFDSQTGDLACVEYKSLSGIAARVNSRSVDLKGDHNWLFSTCDGQLVKKHNKELAAFRNVLNEPTVGFPPTYPYIWNSDYRGEDVYQKKRCPAWPDRVLINNDAWRLMKHDSFSSSSMFYNVVGQHTNMGEHKPVYFRTMLNFADEKD